MHLLEESKISPLNINFVLICIIHKMLVLLKNHLNYIKDSIFKCFFKEYDKILSFFFFFLNFLQHAMMESLSLEEENMLKI